MDERESRLVELVLQGDREAFGPLVTPHRKALLNMAYRLCRNWEDAGEVSQETLLRAFRYLRSYDPRRSFRNWMFQILVNVWRSSWKNRPDPAVLREWAAADPGQLQHFGGKSLITQSHGQSLMSYFRARYRIPGLYLLDEPETALSPRSQVEFVKLLKEMAGQGHAQFIIATHSPILMAFPGALIYNFALIPPQPVAYADLEHVKPTRDFLDNPDAFLNRL